MSRDCLRLFEALDISDSYRILKIICGGNAKLAKGLGVTYHWVDRWGGRSARGGRHRINAAHWPGIVKMSKGLVSLKALELLDARTELVN
jgi:hypothetical protein